jgi:hypothetical protein
MTAAGFVQEFRGVLSGKVDEVGEQRRGLVTGICGCDADESDEFLGRRRKRNGTGAPRRMERLRRRRRRRRKGQVSKEKQGSAMQSFGWMSNCCLTDP